MLGNPSHLAFIILSPILSTGFAFLNVITIYIFYRKIRLTVLSLTVMVHICICDIYVCLISNTFYVANLSHPVYAWSTGAVACKIFKFSTMLTNIAQIYFLCILNADRLRRLLLIPAQQWTKRQGIVFISFGWIAATLVSLPRLAVFNEKIIKKGSSLHNITAVVSYACKPAQPKGTSFGIVTVVTFIVAYAIPACYILYTLGRCQVFMWHRRKQVHIATTSNIVTRMNYKLALTFNLTGALFMLIWTPFFTLSLRDLTTNLYDDNIQVAFSLRCTLLILGSAKPVIYLICLEKFRRNFSFKSKVNTETTTGATDKSGEEKATTSTNNNTKTTGTGDSVV